jgi:hypothetical protein
VAVEILVGAVVAHRGARVGVPGGDLYVPQIHARLEHGRHEGMSEHMRSRTINMHIRDGQVG